MTNANKVAAIISELLGIPCRRRLGAGRHDDIGDIDGLPEAVGA